MIKIKKTIFSILILLIFSGKSYSEISDGIFMTVGNKPITKSDSDTTETFRFDIGTTF